MVTIKEKLNFALHDFGARGVSSYESANIGGASHLLNFLGTDTLSSISWARKYYGEGVEGYSIPASEHSTMTSWGKMNEKDAYENMLNTFEGGMCAIVSDSYDIEHAVSYIYGIALKERIENRDHPIVIRPDSGDPVEISLRLAEIILEKFPFTVNQKGFKVFHKNIRLIWGDGIDIHGIEKICSAFEKNGISVENISFGMGAGLLQKVNRDTLKFAMKCSAIQKIIGIDKAAGLIPMSLSETPEANDTFENAYKETEWFDVFKDPITDKGKKSKKGIQTLISYEIQKLLNYEKRFFSGTHDECLEHIQKVSPVKNYKNELEEVYTNGILYREQSFKEIKELINLKN